MHFGRHDGNDARRVLDFLPVVDTDAASANDFMGFQLRVMDVVENGFVTGYTHMNGKIVVLVDVESDVDNEAVREMGKNIAMQIAALNPKYTSDAEVPQDYKDHEIAILTEQTKNDPKMAGKPEKVISGAVMGRLKKELKEICLLDQEYVKAEDGKQSVAQYVASVAKAQNAKINIKGFVRFETGEGLEKKNEDFAAEVAAQLQK